MCRAFAREWYVRLAVGLLCISVTVLPDAAGVNGLLRQQGQGPIGALEPIATAIALGSAPNPSIYTQPVFLSATVSPAFASGSVAFFDGLSFLGSKSIVGGVASTTVATLTAGLHNLTAVYGGDAGFDGSVSSPVSQLVEQAPTSSSLLSLPNPSSFGQLVTMVAKVIPSSASGAVTFYDGVTGIASMPLVGGVATTTVSTLTAGLHSLTVLYDGNSNYAGSIADPVSQLVVPGRSNTSLKSTPNPSLFGQTVTISASVTPSAASGSVTFFNGAASLGSMPLIGGMATTTVSSLSAGPHVLTAKYDGNANVVGSTSPGLSQVVDLPPAIISSNSATFTAGSPATFTVMTTGYPIAAVIKTGALPLGVAFADLGDGSATISGTATVAGSFPLTIAATNGVFPSAIQAFTLIVVAAPAPVLQNSVSRKTHGSAGTFDLPLAQ